MSPANPHDVIRFWREAGHDNWFARSDAFDAAIAERFATTHADAMAGKLAAWAETAEGALALILVLDQFSRNLFRDHARAFAGDAMALAIADAAIAEQFDHQVDADMRTFFYLPFEHSERLEDQDRSVALFTPLGGEGLDYAEVHRDVIARFGRFPHRNAVLGRVTTPQEQAFLDEGGFSG